MEIKVDKRCFKIDKHNAKAMLTGYPFNGNHIYQAIYCDVQKKPFPMLITLNKTKTNFVPSPLGESISPDQYKIPLKYVALLDSEYFIENNIELWKKLCSNGLFNIWIPESPYKRFNQSRKHPDNFRILLLRIYEIENSFQESEIKIASSRIDHLIANNKNVILKRKVIKDEMFLDIKNRLENSVEPYLIKKESYTLPPIPEENFSDNFYPDQVNEIEKYKEGTVKEIKINAYERNKDARRKCIEQFGCSCLVCSFDFEKKYGKRGKDFIHVHHKIPLSEIGEEYELDPVKDLAPVCPNCHAMLHRHKPAISIEELKNIIVNS